MRSGLSRRERHYQRLRLTLETFDLRRRLAGVRTRLVAGEGKLASSLARRRHGWQSQLGAVAAKLESLSPLAVLARGYAVCWNGDRTAVIRDASAVAVGDRVTVTIQRGELSCDVIDRRLPSERTTPES
jgi:exodeoxyribonuclease VII large subunit